MTERKVQSVSETVNELESRVRELESDRRVMFSLLRCLASELGYDLETVKQGGGVVKASWERKSRLVGVR